MSKEVRRSPTTGGSAREFTPPHDLSTLIDTCCDIAGFRSESERQDLKADLQAIAERYIAERLSPPPLLPPKQSRAALRRLRISIDRLTREILTIPDEITKALEMMMPSSETLDGAEPGAIDEALEVLTVLSHTISEFTAQYRPAIGRGANIPLQSALLHARHVLAHRTGEDLRAKFDKPGGNPPVFVTPAGRAVCGLLIGLDPQITETTVANMLQKLRTEGASPSYADDLEVPGRASLLDASLLPRRAHDAGKGGKPR